MATENGFVTPAEVCEMLGVARPTAYHIIKQLNDELREMGYMVRPGRVSRAYFVKRWFYGKDPDHERGNA